MDKNIRLAFDLGGVIIERKGEQNIFIQESIESVKLTIQKLGPQNVFIISKAKQKYQQKNIDFLNSHNFFQSTGFFIQNLHFVDERTQKGPLGKKLGLTYILDDNPIAIGIARSSEHECILFGEQKKKEIKGLENVIKVTDWKEFKNFLQKIK